MASGLGVRSSAVVLVALVTALFGCGGGDTGTDAAVRVDAPAPTTDAPVAMDDAFVRFNEAGMFDPDAFAATDAPVAASDAPVATTDAPATGGDWATVHTLIAANCGGCHTGGGSGGHNMGGADIMAAWNDSQLPATSCTGLTKGACASVRVASGSMPRGRTLSAAERDALVSAIDAWVAAGQPMP